MKFKMIIVPQIYKMPLWLAETAKYLDITFEEEIIGDSGIGHAAWHMEYSEPWCIMYESEE